MSARDTSPAAHRAQIELLRQMTNSQRASLALRLSSEAIRLSRRAIQRVNPQWTDREVKIEWARIHYGEEIAEKLRQSEQG